MHRNKKRKEQTLDPTQQSLTSLFKKIKKQDEPPETLLPAPENGVVSHADAICDTPTKPNQTNSTTISETPVKMIADESGDIAPKNNILTSIRKIQSSKHKFGKLFFWTKKYKKENKEIGVVCIYYSYASSPIPDEVKEREKHFYGKYKNINKAKVWKNFKNCKNFFKNTSPRIDEQDIYLLDFRDNDIPEVFSFSDQFSRPDVNFFSNLDKECNEEMYLFFLYEHGLNIDDKKLFSLYDRKGETVVHHAVRKGYCGVLRSFPTFPLDILDVPSAFLNETPLHLATQLLAHANSDDERNIYKDIVLFLLEKQASTTIRSTNDAIFSGKDGGTPLHYLCSNPKPNNLPIATKLSYQFKRIAVGGIFFHFEKIQDNYIVREILLNRGKFSANEVDKHKLKQTSKQSASFFKDDGHIDSKMEVRHRISVSSIIRDIEENDDWKKLFSHMITDGERRGDMLLTVIHGIKELIQSKINGSQNVFIGPKDCNQALGRFVKWFNDQVKKEIKSDFVYQISDVDFEALRSMKRFSELPEKSFDQKKKCFLITPNTFNQFYELAHHDESEDGVQEEEVKNYWIDCVMKQM